MKELSSRLQLLLVEGRELEAKMNEFKGGLKEQVDSILTTPLASTTAPSTMPNLIDFSKTV